MSAVSAWLVFLFVMVSGRTEIDYQCDCSGVSVFITSTDIVAPIDICAKYDICPDGHKLTNAYIAAHRDFLEPRSRTTIFGCYAPPLAYGKWCDSAEGIFGKDTVIMSVDPISDTTLFCEINCCGKTTQFVDTVTCSWDCAGRPAVRCYGTPTGSAVRVIQLS